MLSLYKLNSGEEIIGTVIEEDSNAEYIVIKRPLAYTYSPMSGIQFRELSVFSESGQVTFSRKDIIAWMGHPTSFAEMYYTKFLEFMDDHLDQLSELQQVADQRMNEKEMFADILKGINRDDDDVIH